MFDIGTIVAYQKDNGLYFVVNNNSMDGTTTIVRKSNKYKNYQEYYDDIPAGEPDKMKVLTNDLVVVKSVEQQKAEMENK